MSCVAQQLRLWVSVPEACLAPTVAFLSNFCLREEEVESPEHNGEMANGCQRRDYVNRVF